ncbi:hypothetical protein FRB95_000504 [Tulasnella sp. JGI-2019a]|nr:hypothetical protein FRB95_000504 [Tulasnella sp. JGI-2019a]
MVLSMRAPMTLLRFIPSRFIRYKVAQKSPLLLAPLDDLFPSSCTKPSFKRISTLMSTIHGKAEGTYLGDAPKPQYHEGTGQQHQMDPQPVDDHFHDGSEYKPAGKLQGKKAIITGGDSGIGRAVALLFALEGADLTL